MPPRFLLVNSSHWLLQRLYDGIDIVADHAHICALAGSLGAHCIAEKLAADFYCVATALAALDERLNCARINCTLHKHGRNLAANKRIDQLIDLFQRGFALGADALNGEHLEAIGATKVPERVMGRHKHTSIGWQTCNARLAPSVQLLKLFDI